MRKLFFHELSCKETALQSVGSSFPWFQLERGKHSKRSFAQPESSIESLIIVPEPQITPFYKPADYVEALAQLHEELETCLPEERSKLYLLQYQVFRGLGEAKLYRRSLQSSWKKATTIHQKVVLAAWLRYEKRGEEGISDLLASCGKCSQEFRLLDLVSKISGEACGAKGCNTAQSGTPAASSVVRFRIREDIVTCDRQRIAGLSAPLHAMLNGSFRESQLEVIDMSSNGISSLGMRTISRYSFSGRLPHVPRDVVTEVLDFANKFCCKGLKDVCEWKLASLVRSRQDAIEFMECAIELSCSVLAAACLQVLLNDLPACLDDEQVVRMFAHAKKDQRSIMAGDAAFSLYCLLSEVSMNTNPRSKATASFLERLVESASDCREKQFALHRLACVRLWREENADAERLFNAAFSSGHLYSVVGLARLASLRGKKHLALKLLDTVLSSSRWPLGWMYQERALHLDGQCKLEDLNKATELDPTLVYPYMFRAASLMKKRSAEAALMEINRVLGFKLSLECLELRFCCHLALEDYGAALCDVNTILTLSPEYRMIGGRVAAKQLQVLVLGNVEKWSPADCWMQLYDRWSSVDDIGSLSVIHQMLDSDAAKGVLYFRQSLLLLRLNCPEAAMRSLRLAREHAASEHERLVYEGWILYDTGHCEEGLHKAEQSILIQRSFEAFFLKAYALADSSFDPATSDTVVSLLEDALRCPSDRLRKGQALNNLGSVYVDSGKLDLAAESYISALKIGHTRAHQGLARVHCLRNDRRAAYDEMTKLIEKARNNASAYEKRSEYCDRELTGADLQTVTELDPLRVYPYRYRAAVMMDNRKEAEAIAELTKAIAFKADLHLLHLRATFREHVGDISGALQDCRAALSVDPNHQEMLELHSRVNAHEP